MLSAKSRDVLLEMCKWRKGHLEKVLKVAREQGLYQGVDVLKGNIAAVVEAEKELMEEKENGKSKSKSKREPRAGACEPKA